MSQPFVPYALSYGVLAHALQRRRRGRPYLLVCIDGLGGSGKSTLARRLAAASEEIEIVHGDDFYRPSGERYVGPLAERPIGADFDHERLRAEVLGPLRAGQAAQYRIYDWPTDRVVEQPVAVTGPIVLVEGVYGFHAGLAQFYDFSIWVECPRELRLARGLARDGEEARERWEQDWMPSEDQYVRQESPQDRVALVCDGSRDDPDDGVWVLRQRPGLRGKVGD